MLVAVGAPKSRPFRLTRSSPRNEPRVVGGSQSLPHDRSLRAWHPQAHWRSVGWRATPSAFLCIARRSVACEASSEFARYLVWRCLRDPVIRSFAESAGRTSDPWDTLYNEARPQDRRSRKIAHPFGRWNGYGKMAAEHRSRLWRETRLAHSTGDDALILGIDVGTTSTKAVAYDIRGQMLATAAMPTKTHYPRPLWAFFEPEELWQAATASVRAVIEQLGTPERIASVAVASFAEAGVPLDALGNPTYNTIAWFDRRSIPQADWLIETIGTQRLFERSGLALQPIFTLCKLLWLKANEPGAWARTRQWLMADGYIASRLGAAPSCDYSQAARTFAFDLRHLTWDTDLLAQVGIDPTLFPPVMPAGTAIGEVNPAGADATGLLEGTPIGLGGHDHVCGAFAAGVTDHGAVLDSMGTAEALFVALGAPIWDPSLGPLGYTQGAHVAAGKYYGYGGLYTSGAAVDWIRGIVGHQDREALSETAAAVPAGSNGATFFPHLRLSSPPNIDPKSRGAFLGLTTDIDPAALVRAVYEGIAYEARASVEPLLQFAGETLPDVTVIGGSARNELLLQIKASVTNRPHHVLRLHEATALGAALLGGIAAGVYAGSAAVRSAVEHESLRVDPDPEAAAFYEDFFQNVYLQLFSSLKPLNHAIYDRVVDLAAGDDRSAGT